MARPEKGKEKHRIHHMGFRVTERVRHGVEEMASSRAVSMGDIVNEALEEYLERRKNDRADATTESATICHLPPDEALV